jgi:hypothetical protein
MFVDEDKVVTCKGQYTNHITEDMIHHLSFYSRTHYHSHFNNGQSIHMILHLMSFSCVSDSMCNYLLHDDNESYMYNMHAI